MISQRQNEFKEIEAKYLTIKGQLDKNTITQRGIKSALTKHVERRQELEENLDQLLKDIADVNDSLAKGRINQDAARETYLKLEKKHPWIKNEKEIFGKEGT